MGTDFRIAAWLVQPRLNTVSNNGSTVRLEPKMMEVLVCLAQHGGEPVSKEELLQTVWPNTFVTDDVLKRSISELRRVFEDDVRESRIIQTIPRRGYRLLVPVESVNGKPGTISATPSPGEIPQSGYTVRSRIALGLGGTVVLLLVLALGSAKFGWWRSGSGSTTQVHALAVLPLQNLSADSAQEYFSDGITDALITDLAQIRSLKVISRTSSMQYKQTKKSLPDIARELNVDRIVEGTVQRSGDRVRITAQLIDATNDRHVWAESFERNTSDVLQLQDDVAQSIASAIATAAQYELHKARPVHPVDQEAYDNYLKGRYELNKRERVALARARDFFDRATVKDPDYGEGYAGLATCYLLLGEYEVLPPVEAYQKARDAATRALQIDDALSEAHLVIAVVKRNYDWNAPEAEHEFRRGIELSPSSATAHQWYAEMLSEDAGRHTEAIAEIEIAQRLDSRSPIINTIYGDVLRLAGRTDAARIQLEHTLAMDPDFAYAHAVLGNIYVQENLIAKAAEEYRRATVISPHSPWYMSMLAFCDGRVGKRVEAQKLLQALLAQSQNSYAP